MTAEIVEALARAGLRRVAENEPMSRHTSWRIGGPADYCCVANEESQLEAAAGIARRFDIPWLVLGGGNNVLVSDQGVEGLVILNRLGGIAVEPNAPALHCGPGVFFAKAAQYSARHGYTGMEWGIAVPGTVGGGVVNNAGAHWSDVSRSLISATLLFADGSKEEVGVSDLAYRYRGSVLKTAHTTRSQSVVTGCRFRIEPDDPDSALARLEDLRQHRLRTQPVKEASAGSTFKNPPNTHAGALVDQAGLKGHRIGGAQIAPLHANFILNAGGATAADVFELIGLAQRRVQEEFGIRLEPEVQFVGRWQAQQLQSILGEAA